MPVSMAPQRLNETHYSTREAAELLHVTPDTVKRYCNQTPPRIKARKLLGEMGPWFIPKSAIDKYLSEESDLGRPKAAQNAKSGRRKAS